MPIRRLLPLLLALSLLCGCSHIYEGEYQVVSHHAESTARPESSALVYEVHSYVGLKKAVQELVSAAAEQGIIRAVEYSGAAAEDISKACLEVTRETPLGSYAVEYITHTVTRILAYDEIHIHVNYKLSEAEIAAVRIVPTLQDFYLLVDEALASGADSLVAQIVTLAINEQTISGYLGQYYRRHPDQLLSYPDVAVSFYPSADHVQKIIAFDFNYHSQKESRDIQLRELNEQARELTRGMSHLQPEEAALLCCSTISERLSRVSQGRTAYDALVSGRANSEGCAMAYQLLCSLCDIPCRVVVGRLNGAQHYWNLIHLGESDYHVDVSACVGHSLEQGFLKQDSDLWGSYWWDVEQYPACQGSLCYSAVQEQIAARNRKPTPPELPEHESTENPV